MKRAFVEEQREKRDYAAFVERKVEVARASVRRAAGRSDEEVEAEFAARRARVADAA